MRVKTHEKLRVKIREHYKTYFEFAYDLGIRGQLLCAKLDGLRRWYEDEVVGGCKLLNIPIEQAGEYFDLSRGYATRIFNWEKENELTDLVHERYGSIRDLAKEMGIARETLSKRLQGERMWKKSEVDKFCELLQISSTEINRYIPADQIISADYWTERIYKYFKTKRDFMEAMCIDNCSLYKKTKGTRAWTKEEKNKVIELLRLTQKEIPLFFPPAYYQTKLHERIHKYYDSVRELGRYMGLTDDAIYSKTLQNISWTDEEVRQVCELLHINDNERNLYFVEKSSSWKGETRWYSL